MVDPQLIVAPGRRSRPLLPLLADSSFARQPKVGTLGVYTCSIHPEHFLWRFGTAARRKLKHMVPAVAAIIPMPWVKWGIAALT